MFLLDWNLTLYSKALPLEAAMRIWDVYLLEGESMVLRAGLGVLRMYAMKLRKMTIEGIIRFLSRLPDTLGGEV
jgi:TBC1 domain family member 14